MRVALLSQNARSGDAIGRQVAAKAMFFRERGADVRVYVECARKLHPVLEPLVHVIDATVPLETIAGEIRTCDLASIEFGQHYRLAEIMPLLAGGRARILFDYHGVTPPEFAAGNRESLRAGERWRSLAWFADEVSVHSRFMQRELCTATGLAASRVVIAPLYVNRADICEAPRFWQARIGQTQARFALFVGRLAPNKRVPLLIEALAVASNDCPDLHVAIVGDSSGAYEREAARCREIAERLAVSERVHFLGPISDDELAAAFASASVFVMPSLHEGFCLPVIEAMRYGLPVIAARAAALPETLAGAGLLFEPNNADDLARQIRRVLRPTKVSSPHDRRAAIVSANYGAEALGGAERSLRTIAGALAAAGWQIEVFALGKSDSHRDEGGIVVRRFAADATDEAALAETKRLISTTQCDDEIAGRFLELSPASRRLLDHLGARQSEFTAIITGPYCSGLAIRVARMMPDRTLLAPCIHDEPLARTAPIRTACSEAAGLLFHSPDERELAQAELGISHPNSGVIGACLPPVDMPPRLPSLGKPYLLFAGRYCREKNVSLLIEWQKRYEIDRPGRYEFVFAGAGNVPIPSAPPWHDRGFVTDAEKASLMSGAAALVQLSCNESLSLVALEAWQQGAPVIAHRDCRVLAGMVERASGGMTVAGYDEFRACLDDLHDRPDAWREFGRQGRVLVRDEFENPGVFTQRITDVIETSSSPISEQMRRQSRQRGARFGPKVWEEFFAAQVDRLLHQESLALAEKAEIRPRGGRSLFVVHTGTKKLQVEIENTGTVPLAPSLPRPPVVWSLVCTPAGEGAAPPAATRLADWINPGQALPLLLRVKLPDIPGDYRVGVALRRDTDPPNVLADCDIEYPLHFQDSTEMKDGLLDRLHEALAEAERLQDLPDGYTDVTSGALAKFKQWLKQKLLHQFKTAYVDVLSRQQSDWNRQVVAVLQELTECVALLERSAVDAPASDLSQIIARLQRGARSAVERIESLERRLERLEALVQQSPARTQE